MKDLAIAVAHALDGLVDSHGAGLEAFSTVLPVFPVVCVEG